MGAVYKSICYEVDSLMLLTTSLAEKEIQLKIDIEKMMNEGFVNIAKARFVMGSACVTKMQLPTQDSNSIRAVATVSREEINNNWVFKIEKRRITKKKPTRRGLEDPSEETPGIRSPNNSGSIGEGGGDSNSSSDGSKLSIPSIKSETDFTNLLQTDPKSIRKSKHPFLVQDELYQDFHNDLLDEISETDSSESFISVTNPIRLFGVLVPNALKQAQIIFGDAVNLMGECATVQSELLDTLSKLEHLKYVKNLIEEAAVDADIDFLTPKVYWTPSTASSISCKPFDEEGEGEGYEPTLPERKSIRFVFFDKDTEAHAYPVEYPVFGSDSGSDY